MSKRRKTQTPIMLLWSRADQRRFIDTVEALTAAVHELTDLTADIGRRKLPRKPKPAPTDPLPNPPTPPIEESQR
jgi:hypothetical protein